MWMAISSVIAMLSFADLGMGNGVLSEIAKAQGQDNLARTRQIVSSGFSTLTGIGALVLLAFTCAYPWVTWHSLFNVKTPQAVAEAGPALAMFMVVFALNMPLGIVNRVQTGLQQSFRASLWQCAGSALGLIGTLWVIHQELSLPWLVCAMAGAPAVAALVNGLHFFIKSYPQFAPQWSAVSKHTTIDIARTGFLFFVLQIVGAVAFASDNFVIAQSLGATAVTDYAVPEKLFGLITVALSMLLAPLWPAYGEAIARGDHTWVARTLKRSITISMAAAAAMSLAMVWLAPAILAAWVGHQVTPPLGLLWGLAVWKVFEVAGGALAAYLNGAHIVMAQVVLASLTGACALGAKLLLIQQWGIQSIPWAMCGAFVLCSLIPYAVLLPKLINRSHSHQMAPKSA
jgi:O-antigen/teichoic acid export membrane protein